MQLPVPKIDKQREIVKEYHVIINRINLNIRLIQKLEETAQAIYKQWFVDFEFPDENGKPYKSNGGEMIESELGEIPKGWRVTKLSDIIEVINGYAFESSEFCEIGKFPIIKIANIINHNIDLDTAQYFSGEINNSMEKSFIKYGDILISMTGSHITQINSAVGKIGRYTHSIPAILNQRVSKLKPKIKCSEFLFRTMINDETQKEILTGATGSANQANISPDSIKSINIIRPLQIILDKFDDLVQKLTYNISINQKVINCQINLKSILLSKLATIEE